MQTYGKRQDTNRQSSAPAHDRPSNGALGRLNQGIEASPRVLGQKAVISRMQSPDKAGEPLRRLAEKAGAPAQLRRYNIERDIDLDLATKTIGAQKEEGKGTPKHKPFQSAKKRMRGMLYAELRQEYPAMEAHDGTPTGIEKARKYLELKAGIDEKFSNATIDDEPEGTASATRPAIYTNAPAGVRGGGTEAKDIGLICKDVTWIGAHLVKREWGGADNMWNVVAWPETAESAWARTFEMPVDARGLRGENPGNVKIQAQKEDESVGTARAGELIGAEILKLEGSKQAGAATRARTSKTFFEKLAVERGKVNRAVESVPVTATGVNFAGGITLGPDQTAYALAVPAAEKKLAAAVGEDLETAVERTDHLDHRPLPDSLEAADFTEKAKYDKERKRTWEAEKANYKKAGPGKFEFENTLFEE